MKIIRQNPKGGRIINNFPLHTDQEGNIGLMLGYIPEDFTPGDKLLIPLDLACQYAHQFHDSTSSFYRRFKKLKPRKSLRQWAIEKLGGVDN